MNDTPRRRIVILSGDYAGPLTALAWGWLVEEDATHCADWKTVKASPADAYGSPDDAAIDAERWLATLDAEEARGREELRALREMRE